tara:strand:+ start:552 stop:767 length:216 start_codon:yes stop_codon:yes gene_type:complete
MRLIFACILFVSFVECDKKKISCKKEFFECADVCAGICERTIARAYEFGKCFSRCNEPCRAEYCKEMNEDD